MFVLEDDFTFVLAFLHFCVCLNKRSRVILGPVHLRYRVNLQLQFVTVEMRKHLLIKAFNQISFIIA